MPSTFHDMALRFIRCFDAPLDVEASIALRTPTCRHIFAPASVQFPPMDNTAFAAHINGLKDVLEGLPVTAKEIHKNEAKKEVVVWATAEAKFRDDVKDAGIPEEEWSYTGEYIFILSMDESGQKIDRVVEFLDSKAVDGVRMLMQRAKRNKESRGESK